MVMGFVERFVKKQAKKAILADKKSVFVQYAAFLISRKTDTLEIAERMGKAIFNYKRDFLHENKIVGIMMGVC
jgi:hypothetical protein